MAPALAAETRSCEALITTSVEGRILGWSRGAQALFGWREREILGRPLLELLHEKHRSVDEQNHADATAGHAVRDSVVKFMRRDGAALSCLQTMLPLSDAGGRVNGVARLVFDLSTLQEAERALRRSVAELRDVTRSGSSGAPPEGELARTIHRERERTRGQYLRVMASETARLQLLLRELQAAAEAAGAERAERGA